MMTHLLRANSKTELALLLTMTVGMFACSAQSAAPVPASGASTQASVPLIIPQPKSVRMGTGEFRLLPGTKWVLRSPSREEHLWSAAESVLGKSGLYETAAHSWITLSIGGGPITNFPSGPEAPRWASDPEGYQLTIETNGLVLLAAAPAGAFYGLQTLAQLCQGSGPDRACPVLQIDDWPAMRFRGAHWFPSASGVQMHEKLIQNVFGPLKLNRCVIQCEAARWDTHPEITAENAISKADLRKLVEVGRSRYIESIPLLNVPGHAEWIFRNGSNLDFVEDPKTPYAYCVNHPKSFEFIQDVMKETLPIFEPKAFHIGHDEVAMRGRFPNPECPRCKNATMNELVVRHANQLNEWLKQHHVESQMWGDMLLGPGEAKDATHAKTLADAKQRRAGISKEVTIVDWHYAATVDARSFDIFRKEGFCVVAASWYVPGNIHRLSQAALASGAEGLLQTTWMGYFPDERAMKNELRQFTAFVLAAEYAWSGRNEGPSQLGYNPEEVFLKAYRR